MRGTSADDLMSSSSENETLCRYNFTYSLSCYSLGFPDASAINLELTCNQVLCDPTVLCVFQQRPDELYRVGGLSLNHHRDPHFLVDPCHQRLFLTGKKTSGVVSPKDFGA